VREFRVSGTEDKPMSVDAPHLGIDFGTTNSAMAWFNPDTKQAEVIFNSEGEAKTPSLVYYGEDEILVGQPVADLLEESEHYEEAERSDIVRRIVKSIKRNLLAPPVIPIPGREPVRPVEVVAEILGKLKRDAEEGHFQEEVERVVITCPAVFDSLQREVVFDAAALAGFRIVDLVEEPVAAAMAFARLGQKVGEDVLVYDLGGGTFDLAVVVCEDNGSKDELFRVAMEPDGDPVCGGDDFDRAIYDYCDGIARATLGRSVDSSNRVVNPYFLDKCRRQKERLTFKNQATVRDYLGEVLFKADLNRQTFEALIERRVEGTVRKTAAMAERARSRGQDVDTVVLIGGSSQVPLVTQRLRETLAVEPRKFANKDYAVALGAAYYASIVEVPPRERYRKEMLARVLTLLLLLSVSEIRRVQNMLELNYPHQADAIKMQREAGDRIWQITQAMQQQQQQQQQQQGQQ
jgi:molecular chaperone DnaK (HSP70)